MKKLKRIAIILLGILAAVGLSLCVLLCLGFRFSSEAAVHDSYHDATVREEGEYDFYFRTVTNAEGTVLSAGQYTAVKQYGFLYKNVKEDPALCEKKDLTLENGDYIGSLTLYKGKESYYGFLSLPFRFDASGDATVSRPDHAKINGEDTSLYLNSFFKTAKPVTSLEIDGASLIMVEKWARPETEKFAPAPDSLQHWITEEVSLADFAGLSEVEGWFGAREFYAEGYRKEDAHQVRYLLSAYPDYADEGLFVTKIYISDPAVSVYGITTASSAEEFVSVFSQMGFHTSTSESNGYRFATAKKYDITFSFREATEEEIGTLQIEADVTNREKIDF